MIQKFQLKSFIIFIMNKSASILRKNNCIVVGIWNQNMTKSFWLLFPITLLLSSPAYSQNQNSQLISQTKYLLEENFQGAWVIQDNKDTTRSQPWDQLWSSQGRAILTFNKAEEDHSCLDSINIDLLMPQYFDQKVIRLTISVKDKYNDLENEWSASQQIVYQVFEYSQLKNESSTCVAFRLNKSLVSVRLSMNGALEISFSPKYLNPFVSFFFSIFALAMYIVMWRKQSMADTQIRHSLIPIILSSVMTFLVFAVEIVLGVRSLFGKMSPEAFFIVAAGFNLGLCCQVVRFYWRNFLWSRAWTIIIFWIISSAYIWFLLFFRHNDICLILNSLVLLPEIGYHYYKGRKIQPDLRLLLFVLSNQIYVLYYKSCPTNIFYESPSPRLVYCICSLLFTQTILYLGQIYISPRFFIPSLLRGATHDYFNIQHVSMATTEHVECHICLQEIKLPIKKGEGQAKVCNQSKTLMITPCQHMFHRHCLEKWMIIQMKCPVDRLLLPAF